MLQSSLLVNWPNDILGLPLSSGKLDISDLLKFKDHDVELEIESQRSCRFQFSKSEQSTTINIILTWRANNFWEILMEIDFSDYLKMYILAKYVGLKTKNVDFHVRPVSTASFDYNTDIYVYMF
jgi:hypothetical protein